jgi:hypothetical protein
LQQLEIKSKPSMATLDASVVRVSHKGHKRSQGAAANIARLEEESERFNAENAKDAKGERLAARFSRGAGKICASYKKNFQ